MEFFNKKEEILEVKLTEIGKDQLSKGRLKPAYYAFFDDDVLYDSNCAGFSEPQNMAEQRIKFETPALKIIANTTGVETRVRQFLADVSSSLGDQGQTPSSPVVADNSQAFIDAFKQDSFYSQATLIPDPLGTSKLTTPYNAAWNITALANEISSSRSTTMVAKKPGKSAFFGYDGITNQQLRIGSASDWNALIGGAGAAAKAFTLTAWIYPLSQGMLGRNDGRIFDFASGDRRLNFQDNGKIQLWIQGATDIHRRSPGGSAVVNKWQHVVATYSGGNAGSITIYIDGVYQQSGGSDAGAGNAPIAIAGTHTCVIGNRHNGNRSFHGYITDATVWDAVLTQAEVTELYNGGKYFDVKKHSAVANCKAWYRMGSGNDAVLVPTGDTERLTSLRDRIAYRKATGHYGLRAFPVSIPGDYIGGITKNIPQLDVLMDYRLQYENGEITGAETVLVFPDEYENTNNLHVNLVKNDYLVLEIMEENTSFEKENFDIEVYLVSGSGVTPQASPADLRQLSFAHEIPENAIIVGSNTDFIMGVPGYDPANQGSGDSQLAITNRNVEHFLNIQADQQIPQSISEKLNISSQTITSNRARIPLNRDLYTTDNEEPCD